MADVCPISTPSTVNIGSVPVGVSVKSDTQCSETNDMLNMLVGLLDDGI